MKNAQEIAQAPNEDIISKAKILITAQNFIKSIPPPFAFVDHFFLMLMNKWRSSSA